MNKGRSLAIMLLLLIFLLFAGNLLVGSVDIPMRDVWTILTNSSAGVKPSWQYIVWESRLPQAMTALFSGAALAVSGLLLQTAFGNPLAGPDVFGISSGASLAVALVTLSSGGSLVVGNYGFVGFWAMLLSAFAGALSVTAIIFFFSTLVNNRVLLLIIGMMIGYVSGSVISLLHVFATGEGIKSYTIWGMGSFGNVTFSMLPLFVVVTSIGLLLSLLLVKPLNILLLGERYARNLGVRTHRLRHILLLLTGLLTAVVTAFCGPVSFIGLSAPHIVRLLLSTENHRLLLPVTSLMGAVLALLCNLLSFLPGEHGILPINVITPLIGAPVILFVIMKGHR